MVVLAGDAMRGLELLGAASIALFFPPLLNRVRARSSCPSFLIWSCGCTSPPASTWAGSRAGRGSGRRWGKRPVEGLSGVGFGRGLIVRGLVVLRRVVGGYMGVVVVVNVPEVVRWCDFRRGVNLAGGTHEALDD